MLFHLLALTVLPPQPHELYLHCVAEGQATVLFTPSLVIDSIWPGLQVSAGLRGSPTPNENVTPEELFGAAAAAATEDDAMVSEHRTREMHDGQYCPLASLTIMQTGKPVSGGGVSVCMWGVRSTREGCR